MLKVPGRMFPVEEFYLEDILVQVDYKCASKKKQESSLPQPTLPSEKIPQDNIQESMKEVESERSQSVEEVPEVIEEQLNDFESRLKRLTYDD